MNGSPKAVADPVHGTILLTPLEAAIISTRAFQRLRGVKQLGLAHMVFPGADYSRFSHSLGVCHVTGRILSALQEQAPDAVSDEEIVLFRLAGLLHDVGHYPFSHATEYALGAHYTQLLVEPVEQAEDRSEETSEPPYLDHERIGVLTVEEDREIRDLLQSAGIDPSQVWSIFTRKRTDLRLANLISSDMDADRIDYLMRTALHTGLPYGHLDLEYLLTQFRFDKDGNVCLHPKALRAVEHFLLARYFDYQQVTYHKTVAGLELVLKDVIGVLVAEGRWKASAREIRAQLEDGTWATVDDSLVLQLVRDLASETKDDVIRAKANAILYRSPPKLIVSSERFAPREPGPDRERWRRERQQIEKRKKEWAQHFGIDEQLWYIWEQSNLGLTKISPQIPVSEAESAEAIKAKAEQVVRLLVPSDGTSIPIFSSERSMMTTLARHTIFALRVYVVLPPEKLQLRTEMEAHIRDDAPIGWLF